MTKQARGYKGKVLIDFEPSFGVVPDAGSRKPFLVPFNSFDVSASRELNTSDTITGSRNPVAPFEGNVDASGSATVPMDAHSVGLWLRAMFGLPVSTVIPSVSLAADSAVDKGSGKVGFPSIGHGLEPGTPVIIDGTTNYDGAHVLAPETSADQIVIKAAFSAETFDGTETVTVGRRLSLTAGDAVGKGGETVGLPCSAHGLPVGGEIAVLGTTAYNGTYTVLRGTTADEIVISKAFTAETFDGTETVDIRYHRHAYTVGDESPSMVMEKQFPDIPLYLDASGMKVGSCSVTVGGSGELTLSVNLVGRNEERASGAYDANENDLLVELPFARFSQFHARLREGGEVLSGRNTSVSLSMDFGLDTDQYTIGDGGARGDIPEGGLQLSGDIEALFKDTRFLDKAENGERTAIEIEWGNGGYSLGFKLAEAQYQRKTPSITGPKGIKENFSYTAFHDTDSAASAVVVTLVNDIKTWEA